MNRLLLILRFAVPLLLAPSSLAAELTAPEIEATLARLARYQAGQDRAPLTTLAKSVQTVLSDPKQKTALEQRLVQFLQSDATPDGKKVVLKELTRIATDASVPTLGKLLLQPDLSDRARYALEVIPGNGAAETLRSALAKTSGASKIGIIGSLGQRRDDGAVPLLAPLIADSNPDVAAAAVSVLGQLATPDAVSALIKARPRSTEALGELILDALLQSADSLADNDKGPEALPIYQEILQSDAPGFMRSAALRGLVLADPAKAPVHLERALKNSDPEIQSVAIGLAARNPAPEMTSLLVKALAGVSAATQLQLLTALGQRGDPAALPTVVEIARDPSSSLRESAIEQLAFLGDAATVPLLASIAATERGSERLKARASLYRLKGEEINSAIVNALPNADPGSKVELISAVGQRGIAAGTAALMSLARDSDRRVRSQALKVLTDFAGPEQLIELLQLLLMADDDATRSGTEKVLAALFHRHPQTSPNSLVASYSQSGDAAVRASLLSVLGVTGTREALATLKSALNDNDVELRKAAIRALSEWNTPDPMPLLLDVAQNDSDPACRILGLRGYVSLAGIKSPRSSAESVALLGKAMAAAERATEKRSILALLPRFPGPEAIDLARSQLADPELAREAQLAIDALNSSSKR